MLSGILSLGNRPILGALSHLNWGLQERVGSPGGEPIGEWVKRPFQRQHPVGGFIVDFACPQLCLAIELDGSQHDEGRSKDEWRSEKLAEEGYRILRFWNNEVLGNLDGVLDVIYAPVEEGEKRWG